MTGRLLRLLMVEDSKADALLTLLELRRGGYATMYYHRVDTEEGFRSALGCMTWDIILCDNRMPPFSGRRALQVLQETGLDLPLIFVCGPMPDTAVRELLGAGARGYIPKDRLDRLVPMVQQALREARGQ